MVNRTITLLIAVIFVNQALAQSKHSKISKYTSYKGLIMAGYQGWFNAPDDGANRGWRHYAGPRGVLAPGSIKVDMWPETDEYEKTYKTQFLLVDGSAAVLPSPHDASTVKTHFKWMKEYGVDGVFMQRFVAEVRNSSGKKHFNKVLASAMKSSKEYGRAISVMYDFSGMSDNDIPVVIEDWKNLVDSMKITSQGSNQTYLYHNGKPLVVLWGVGFGDGRKYSLQGVEKIIEFLQNDPEYGGCSIMLGVPTYWRELDRDTGKDPRLLEILKKIDIIHPWTIGRFGNEAGYKTYIEVQKGDIAWAKENKVDYVPVVFPGFSWHNMYPKDQFDKIPRNSGKFLWMQLSNAIKNGAEMIYIAMFDEVDEGTAIFKVSRNPPVGESPFVKFEEGIPSDYYLFLSGYAGKMLRKTVPFTSEAPPPKNSNASK
ncbi:glycoside hydrolase family 71/99-like protein [Daejeonella sp.]|uniref:glycoside hydrolase family 71/99-like protein n=1 Tax=Daejeonella sp. TaxID=2805397 RepID=UPI0039837603